MPVTHNNLWDEIVNFESLYQGYRAAARNKRYQAAALNYRERLEENLINTLNLLTWRQWTPAPYREFCVYEPKKRIVNAPAFKDRVVHHALVRVIEPIFEKKFIYDSYACRKGKGTHAAKERVESFVAAAQRKGGSYYVLKGDIKSYFYSIDRRILLDLIQHTVSDKDVLWLIRQLISFDGDRKGIPIGALTSQLFANVYLDILDHHLKDNIGVKMYARYMDDFLLIHPNKNYLSAILAEIEVFLEERLHLTLNPKTCIYKSGKGQCHSIDFCGYRIWPGYAKPRKRTVRTARKRFRKLAELHAHGEIALSRLRASVMSFIGYMKHCDGALSLESTLGSFSIRRMISAEIPSEQNCNLDLSHGGAE